MSRHITTSEAQELTKMTIDEIIRRGCDCCDPTHDSPDPVVVRLQAEIDELSGKAGELEAANEELRAEVNRLNTAWTAIDRANESLRERLGEAKALLLSDTATEPCGHAHKWLAHRDPIDQASPTYCTFCEMARLRGLLREAWEKRYLDDDGNECEHVTSRWLKQAALEGKP